MNALNQRSVLIMGLLYLSVVLRAIAQRTRACAKSLAARRSRGIALRQLSAMSERELRDIGLSHSDIERVASQSFDERNSFRID